MTLEEYAFWMRLPLAEVERVFCREVIDSLMMYVEHDHVWRVWTGSAWLELDPWKFAVEADLASQHKERREEKR